MGNSIYVSLEHNKLFSMQERQFIFQRFLSEKEHYIDNGSLGGSWVVVVDAPKGLVFFTDGPVQSMIGGQVRNMSLGPD